MALMPVNNPKSLIAYYLGFFALLPIIGILAAIPAIVLGIAATRYAAQLPNNEGHGHAVVGIILGVIGLFISLGCGGIILLSLLAS